MKKETKEKLISAIESGWTKEACDIIKTLSKKDAQNILNFVCSREKIESKILKALIEVGADLCAKEKNGSSAVDKIAEKTFVDSSPRGSGHITYRGHLG